MTIEQVHLSLLNECANHRISVFFSSNRTDVVFQTHIVSLDKEKVILANKVPPQYISRIVKSENFFLQCRMLRFISSKINSDGKNILFPLDALQVIEETRKSERFPFTAEENVICELLNPYDEETTLSKSVMDMSATGLSFRSAAESSLFKPGTYFSELKVLVDGSLYRKAKGRVVYLRKLLDLQGKLRLQVGLELDQ